MIAKEACPCQNNSNLDLYILKETYIYIKRPKCVKRDPYISKETWKYQKRPINVKLIRTETCTYQKRPCKREGICKPLTPCTRDICMSKETYIYQKRRTSFKRGLYISKWPMHICKDRDLQTANALHKRQIMSKETCICEQRPIFFERGLYISKETYRYTWIYRDLQTANDLHKRLLYVKRDL